MQIITLLVLIGLFYWIVKILYEIIRFLFYLMLFIVDEIRILLKV